MSLDIAVVGTGANPDEKTVDGFSMAYTHADAYEAIDDCTLVACADIVPENAHAFADRYDIDADRVFEDHETMVNEVEPDVVSVTVPPAAHADIVIECAESRCVEAIHCEKPVALTWTEAREMVAVADANDVKLTFNHQRRFGKPFREAKRLLDSGEIGTLERITVTWGDLYDTGSHTIDLCNYFNGDRGAEWTIAQLDYRHEDIRFGVHTENQIFAMWKYENGVHAIYSSGEGSGLADAAFSLEGSHGEIQIGVDDGPVLRVQTDDDPSWRRIDCDGESMHESTFHHRSIADAIDAVRNGTTSELSAQNALKAMEIIFGGYESVRQRKRVELPPESDDNPLEALVESGELNPTPSES